MKEEISSLKRPIKKVLHESEMKSDLPEDIEGLDVVCSTFNAADKILEKKSVELKGVELEKLNNFRNKINSGHFEEIKKSYQKLGSQKTELESAYNKLVNVELEKRAIEQKIKEIEIDIEKLKSEDQKLEREKLRNEQGIESLKSEMEKLVLEKFGITLKVV